DQDAAHGLSSRSEEVPAAVPRPFGVAHDEPEVGLVDQRGGLERLARLLLGQPGGCQLPQFVVHEWQQFGRGVRVAGRGRVKELGDVGHAAEGNRRRGGGQGPLAGSGPRESTTARDAQPERATPAVEGKCGNYSYKVINEEFFFLFSDIGFPHPTFRFTVFRLYTSEDGVNYNRWKTYSGTQRDASPPS